MKNQHPITPTAELVNQWFEDTAADSVDLMSFATTAAQWGADQELEACCALIDDICLDEALRAARRPNLKEQALKALKALEDDDIDVYLIRRALEALPND